MFLLHQKCLAAAQEGGSTGCLSLEETAYKFLFKQCRLILQNESRYIQYRQSSKNNLCFSSNYSLVQYLQQFWATWLQPDKMMIFCRKKISQSSPSRPAMSFFIFSHILFTMVDPYNKHGQRFK